MTNADNFTEQVVAVLRTLRPERQREVLDFVEFLRQRQTQEGQLLDERQARRKARGWLFDFVGTQVDAQNGELAEREGRSVWRFAAFVTGGSHKPWGPIGQIEVDATTGEVLANPDLAEELITHGARFVATLSSTEG